MSPVIPEPFYEGVLSLHGRTIVYVLPADIATGDIGPDTCRADFFGGGSCELTENVIDAIRRDLARQRAKGVVS